MAHEKKAEGWWTDTKKILITQALTVILTPLTLWVTLHYTEKYKAPEPRIEYTSVVPYSFLESPRKELGDRIRAEPRLVFALRGELRNQDASPACVSWLDGADWSSE